MIALIACIYKAICDFNDQYPDMIVSVLSKIEVSMRTSGCPNRVDAHGVIIIRGSGPRFVKFSNGPNTNSECSNLLN